MVRIANNMLGKFISKIKMIKIEQLLIISILITVSLIGIILFIHKHQKARAGSDQSLISSFIDPSYPTKIATISACNYQKSDPQFGNVNEIVLSLDNPTDLTYFSFSTYRPDLSQSPPLNDYRIDYFDNNNNYQTHYFNQEGIHQSFQVRGNLKYSFLVSSSDNDEFFASFSKSPRTSFGLTNFLNNTESQMSIASPQAFNDGLFNPKNLPTCSSSTLPPDGSEYTGETTNNYYYFNNEALSDYNVILSSKPYTLKMQPDGSLAEFAEGSEVWSTKTVGAYQAYAMLGKDGNFGIYTHDNKSIWSTNTSGNPGAFLSLSSEGTVSILSKQGQVLWTNQIGGAQ
jgi:hypothetical protein